MIQSKLYMSEAVFFLFVAVFLGAYLYGTLGRENEDDEKLREKYFGNTEMFGGGPEVGAKPGDIEGKALEILENEGLDEKLKEIRKRLPDFDPIDFQKKSIRAFEIICNSYIEKDVDTLRTLLSEKVFTVFSENIAKLQQKGQHVKNLDFLTNSSKFYAIHIDESEISIAMRIISAQCNVILDKDENHVAGSNDVFVTHNEIWTFTKKLDTNDKTWIVSDIQVSNEK